MNTEEEWNGDDQFYKLLVQKENISAMNTTLCSVRACVCAFQQLVQEAFLL